MATKKVIIVGSSGCGKTSLFQYLTGKTVVDSPKRSRECEVATLSNHPDIVVVDTPGLEGDDDEWWEHMQPHQSINFVIIMFNGTNDRVENLSKLNYVHKYLKEIKDHLKVLAIKGNNFNHADFEYEFLEDHLSRVSFNQAYSSSSGTGTTTREKIYDLVCAAPAAEIVLFSPVKMVEALNTMKQELAKAVKRNGELEESLMEAQKKFSTTYDSNVHLEDNLNKLQKKYDLLVVRAKNADLEAQRRIGLLVNHFFETDQDGNEHVRASGRGWHLLNWLPFAGTILAEKKRSDDEKVGGIVKQLETSYAGGIHSDPDEIDSNNNNGGSVVAAQHTNDIDIDTAEPQKEGSG